MKKIKRLIYAFALGMLITSCGPPDAFEKGADFYQAQKYDSAMYYFDRLLPEDKDWLDSSKAMKKLCFEKIILAHNWELYNSQLDIYGKDSLLMNLTDKDLEEELINMINKDSTKAFYKVYDTYKDRFDSLVLTSVMNKHIDDFLKDYNWKGTKDLSKGKLKYERNSKNESQLISNINNSFWSKNIIIYKEIKYSKEGKFSMKPRIFRGGSGSSYFGRKGSLTFIGKDSLSVNYGTRGIGKGTFIRGDKLEAVLSKK
jgi:hypothetical protein